MVRIAQMLPSEMRGAYSTRDSREPWSIRGQDDFVEVVAPTDFSSADRLFGEWLAERRLSRSDLRDDDIRIDIVRMQDGRSAKRYRVWKSFATGASNCELAVGSPLAVTVCGAFEPNLMVPVLIVE